MAMIDTERYAQELSKLRETVEKAADALHLPQLEEELTELKEEMNEPEFWNDLQRSTTVNRKVGQIEGKINHVARLRSRADDIEAMLMLLNEEADEEMGAECEKELADLTADADALELETMMRGEYDSCNAVLSLHAGAGGQHVNRTDSAVRMTHIPTGIVAQCQNERSQIQNREVCLRILKSRLLELKQREREEQMSDIKGEMKKIEWGSQIRSYVFQPYTMVKDHRTGYESGNVDDVMDGNLDGFITAYLKMQ